MMSCELSRDCKGTFINTGDVVQHGNKIGIIVEDDYEGQYVVLENCKKLRVKDFCEKLTVIFRKKKK